MIVRMFVAVLGAVVITGTLLLAMRSVTLIFRESDDTQYFRISDVQMRSDPRRPERPPPAARQPGVPEAEVDLPDDRVPLDTPPAFDAEAEIPARLLEPELERPAAEAAPD